ncbi:50S ribosomal protein L18 [Candidatus Kuenenbacteria bacterium]|nr:50S ribosomal protein L18 [Candidatus Kuenenbacteria bacterium]
MKNNSKIKKDNLERRQKRIRAKIFGTPKIPRLSVSRSLKYIFLQLIDDQSGKTLVSVHSKNMDIKGTKTEIATSAGRELASKAKKAGINQCVFDRSGRKYHGRVKAVAEGARENGLQF